MSALVACKKHVENRTQNISVAMRLGETPVPIPNTMVKPQAADGTALETVWESRWAPDQKKKNSMSEIEVGQLII